MRLKKHKLICAAILLLTVCTALAVILWPKPLPVCETGDLFLVKCGGNLAFSDELLAEKLPFDMEPLWEHLPADFCQKNVLSFPNEHSYAYNIQIYGGDVYFTQGMPGRVYRRCGEGLSQLLTLRRVNALTVQDGRIFFLQPVEAGGLAGSLYFSRGTLFQKKIADCVCSYTVIGDRVFYVEYENYALYAYDIPTEETTCLHSGEVRSVVSDGAYIYYTRYDYSKDEYWINGELYRAAPDGSDPQLLLAQVCWNLYLYGDWILYQNMNDGRSLYRINKDGTENCRLYEGMIGEYYILDGMILFERLYDDWYLGDVDGETEVTVYRE